MLMAQYRYILQLQSTSAQLSSPPTVLASAGLAASDVCKIVRVVQIYKEAAHGATHSDPDEGKLKVAEDRSQVGKCHRRTE